MKKTCFLGGVAVIGTLVSVSAFAAYGTNGNATIYGQMPNVCQVEVSASTSTGSKLDLSNLRDGLDNSHEVFSVSEKCTDEDGYTVQFQAATSGQHAALGRLVHDDYNSQSPDNKHFLEYGLRYGYESANAVLVDKLDGTANNIDAHASYPAGVQRKAYIIHDAGSGRLIEGDFVDTVTVSISGADGGQGQVE